MKFTYRLMLGLTLMVQAEMAISQTSKADKQLFLLELQKAEKTLEKQLRSGDSSALLKYADVLFVIGKPAEAYQHYQAAFISKRSFDAKQERNFTHAATQAGKPSPYYRRTGYFDSLTQLQPHLQSFAGNSAFEDFGAISWNEFVLFASARKRTTNRDKFDYALTRQPYLDIVATDSLGKEVKPSFLPADLNSEWHDGPMALTRDTSLLLVTRNYAEAHSDGKQHLYIAVYERRQGKWLKAQLLPFCKPEFSVQHPFYNEQEQTLYFSSNMPGGKGGFDLYKSRWSNGGWSAPENLGELVNSAYDEVFPAFDVQGQLYYASNHPETHGGLDIVTLQEGKRKLLPSPINSVFDDYAAHFVADGKMMFSSNRALGAFNDDVYWAHLEKVVPPKPVVYELLASVLDAKTGEPVKKVWIDMVSSAGDSSRLLLSAGTGLLGKFNQQLPQLRVRLSAPGYDTLELTSLPYSQNDTLLTAILNLAPIELPLAVTGYLAIYFPNAQPRAIAPAEVRTIDYSRFYNQYKQEKPVFLKMSANSDPEVEAFFAMVDQGMADLKLFPARLDTVLRTGRALKVYMASYTSALGSAESNRGISERRGLVLKNYIVNWNNGELRKYIESGQLVVNADFFPAFTETTTTTSKSTNKAVTIYGVDASRMRRVNVVWETID